MIAVETDPQLVEGLRERWRSHPEQFSNAEIVAGDILTIDLATLAPGQNIRVYGNLPYYITSPILRRLFDIADRILSIHIVIQLEVAQRIVAGPGFARLRLSFGGLPVLHAPANCFQNSGRRFSPASPGYFGARADDSSGRTRRAGYRE